MSGFKYDLQQLENKFLRLQLNQWTEWCKLEFTFGKDCDSALRLFYLVCIETRFYLTKIWPNNPLHLNHPSNAKTQRKSRIEIVYHQHLTVRRINCRSITSTFSYSLKAGHFAIPYSLFALNRRRLCDRLKQEHGITNGLIFLQGGISETRHATDHEPCFRQESFFWWSFGVQK